MKKETNLHPLFPNLNFTALENPTLNFFAAHAILLDKNNQIVLVKEDGDNFFNIPGGHHENNETAQQTVERECMEELGLSLNSKTLTYLGNLTSNNIVIALFLIRNVNINNITKGPDIVETKIYKWEHFLKLIKEINPKLADTFKLLYKSVS